MRQKKEKRIRMNQKKIKVKDRNGNFNNWIIYGETGITYKICAECDKSFITEIYKHTTNSIDGVLYSTEIKSPFSLLPEWYAKAEYCEIRLKEQIILRDRFIRKLDYYLFIDYLYLDII